jgi:hypothetical protein
MGDSRRSDVGSFTNVSERESRGFTVRRIVCGLAFLGAILLSLPASAQSQPTLTPYSGAACEPYQHVTSVPMNLYRNTYGLFNATGGSLQVKCPIVNLTVNGTGGASFAAVYVNNSSGTLSCTLYSMNVDGTLFSSQTQSTSYAGEQALYFNGPTTSAFWGNWLVACSLPNAALLHEYVVQLN